MPCIISELTFAFLPLLLSFILFKSVGTKQMIVLLHFLTIIAKEKGITKCVKAAIGILSLIQLQPKLLPYFWSIFTDFQNQVLVQPLISRPNMDQIERFVDQSLHWLICRSKTIPTFKIGDLVFVLPFIKQQVLFDSPGIVSPSYCLTKSSIRARRSISRVFSLFIIPSPFFYIARTKAVTGLRPY